MIEIWKPIENYENYLVSNLGNVKSLKTNKILKYSIHKKGYASIVMKQKSFLVHRLVAKTFLEIVDGKNKVNHINCIKDDNRLVNLEWVDSKENSQHAKINNLYKKKFGIDNHNSRKVKQLSKSGELIKIWDSLSDVKRELNLDVKNLVYCCQKKLNYNTSGGYKWEYFD